MTKPKRQSPTVLEIIPDMTDDALLAAYDGVITALKEQQALADRMKYEIIKRADQRMAEGIPSMSYNVKVSRGNKYDTERLAPLKELLLSGDLAICYTPAREETKQVPEKWNMTKLNSIAKAYGINAIKIIEDAKTPGEPTVKFEPRKL